MIPGVSSASPFFIRFTDCSDEQRETISQCWGLIFEMLDEFMHFSEQIQSVGVEVAPFPWKRAGSSRSFAPVGDVCGGERVRVALLLHHAEQWDGEGRAIGRRARTV